MATAAVQEMHENYTRVHSAKQMIANKFARVGSIVAIGGTTIVATASAAVDFSNISSLVQAVVSLVPDFVDLVIGIAPLIVTIAIISFIVGLLGSILGVIKGGMH